MPFLLFHKSSMSLKLFVDFNYLWDLLIQIKLQPQEYFMVLQQKNDNNKFLFIIT